jgi:hypothetical protein
MRRIFTLGTVLIGGMIAARRLQQSKGWPPARRSNSMMGGRRPRMIDELPDNSPLKLVRSILPRLDEENEEIIRLLRERNHLLHREQAA